MAIVLPMKKIQMNFSVSEIRFHAMPTALVQRILLPFMAVPTKVLMGLSMAYYGAKICTIDYKSGDFFEYQSR